MTIPAGDTTATIVVPVIAPDSLVEGTETVEITLDGISSSDPGVSIDNGNKNATINILDNDSATVSIAGVTDGNEAGPVDGVFTVTMTTAAAIDTEIDYTVTGSATEGTDYDNLSGTVIILAGETTATILIENVDQDSLVEDTETVVITLDTITASNPGVTIDGASASDTIDIFDGDTATVSIAGTKDADENGAKDGEFTVTQALPSVSDTVISYTVAGTATAGGTDYTTLSGTVTILAGDTEAVIDVTGIIEDSLVEGSETVEITLDSITSGTPGVSIDGAANNDSIDILDADTALVSIAGSIDGNEAGPVDGVFTVTQTLTAVSDTVIDYTVTGSATEGTDYDTLSGTVTIPAGATSVTILIENVDQDLLVEGPETVNNHAGYDYGIGSGYHV